MEPITETFSYGREGGRKERGRGGRKEGGREGGKRGGGREEGKRGGGREGKGRERREGGGREQSSILHTSPTYQTTLTFSVTLSISEYKKLKLLSKC